VSNVLAAAPSSSLAVHDYFQRLASAGHISFVFSQEFFMHLVQTMAYTNDVPWHGLGQQLAADQPLEVWAEQAGMNWRIESSDVRFATGNDDEAAGRAVPGQQVLYRSDTKQPLAIVSKRFHVVQPREILEFYRDLTDIGGYELETAGVLKEGRKFWALARTGQSTTLKGGDEVNGYLLLATACDGTLATTAQFTSVRVVCNNTLSVALSRAAEAVKVPHRSQFDAQAVKQQLGIAISSWEGFADRMKELSRCHITDRAVDAFLRRVLTYPALDVDDNASAIVNDSAIKAVRGLYEGRGKGSLLGSAAGTAWGLVNSVTEYVDHHRRARSGDHRRDAAWFGQGATLKTKAWDEALVLVS
jgi:phage/plasmid-like protein (TIGR03299 family)